VTVVDTSTWVDYFNGQVSPETNALDDLLGRQEIIVGDLILTEVLQGFRQERHFRQALRLLRAFPVVPMLGPDIAVHSAKNYRALRRRGVTVRKTIDIMIGTYCLAQSYPLLYSDRDFDPMVRHLGLLSAL
jgi:predicted nucleic acid-binding protein